MTSKVFIQPITFNNPIKNCIPNNKYPVKIQTRLTQIVSSIFFIKKNGFNCIFKDYWYTKSDLGTKNIKNLNILPLPPHTLISNL